MNNYDDDEDEEDESKINIDKKNDDNFNDFLLKEGLL